GKVAPASASIHSPPTYACRRRRSLATTLTTREDTQGARERPARHHARPSRRPSDGTRLSRSSRATHRAHERIAPMEAQLDRVDPGGLEPPPDGGPDGPHGLELFLPLREDHREGWQQP